MLLPYRILAQSEFYITITKNNTYESPMSEVV